MDDQSFRDAMGKFSTGIAVITTEYDDKIVGMTVNTFVSISLNPRLIAISIGDTTNMYRILSETKKFGVSILKEDQKELSMIFSNQIKKSVEIHFEDRDGLPVIKNSLATISCHVKNMVIAGDHMIFISEVTDFAINEGDPILYFGSCYRTIQSME